MVGKTKELLITVRKRQLKILVHVLKEIATLVWFRDEEREEDIKEILRRERREEVVERAGNKGLISIVNVK